MPQGRHATYGRTQNNAKFRHQQMLLRDKLKVYIYNSMGQKRYGYFDNFSPAQVHNVINVRYC